jgi:glycine/D-amino acid oxidase-like deaminating enzyme
VRSGLLQLGNYSVETGAYAEALVNAAKSVGLGVITGDVTGLRSKDRFVTELEIGTETLAVGGVLFANGPWCYQAGNWLQCEIPVHPVSGQLLVAETPDAKLDFDITYGLSGIYVQPDGSKVLGGTEEIRGLDPVPTEAGKTAVIGQINRFVDLGRIKFKSHGAAGRPVSSDQLPIVGKVPDWENTYILTGGGRKGVLYSSGMGYAITQEIVAGKQWPLASNLSPARFMNRN